MRLNEHLAQTGRTDRMIQRAMDISLGGRHVLIMCASQVQVKTMEHRLRSVPGPSGSIQVITLPRDFDWETMRPKNAAHDYTTVYLPDHTVAEQEILRLQAKIAHFQLLQMQIYPMTL